MSEDFESVIYKVKPDNSSITNDTYIYRLKSIASLGVNLQDYEEVLKAVTGVFKKKTVKSCLTAVSIYLQGTNVDPFILKKFNDGILKIGKEIVDEDGNNEPTEKEKKNMVTKEEIQGLIDSYSNLENFEESQRHLVLNLYHLIPPVRNDFVGTLVYATRPVKMKDDFNYIILSEKIFVVNRYKTANKYGTVELPIPVKLRNIINIHMKKRKEYYPSLKTRALLVNKNLVPMTQVNLTMYLNSIFKRNVSTTMLRKSYISDKYPVVNTVNQMKEDAKNMMHSVATQQSTYRKRN